MHRQSEWAQLVGTTLAKSVHALPDHHHHHHYHHYHHHHHHHHHLHHDVDRQKDERNDYGDQDIKIIILTIWWWWAFHIHFQFIHIILSHSKNAVRISSCDIWMKVLDGGEKFSNHVSCLTPYKWPIQLEIQSYLPRSRCADFVISIALAILYEFQNETKYKY